MWEIKLFHKTTYTKLPTLLSCREYCSSSSLASVKRKINIKVNTCNLSVRSRNLHVQYCAKVMQTIIDEKSVCSDLSRLITIVSAKHLMDTINQRDIILVRLLCNNREIKHDVHGKRQKWNFCRLSSALSTVESKYLYLLSIVRDTFLFSCDLFKDYKKRIEKQR